MVKRKINALLNKLGFDRTSLVRFLVIAIGSQTIFSFFAIRVVLYNPLKDALGVTNTQLGILMSLTGIGVLFSAVLGFVQNRFDPKHLLMLGLFINGVCVIIISTLPNYAVLLAVYAVMGFVGMAVFWPAVLNSVRRITTHEHQGTAFGFLELIRRSTELVQNMLAIAIFSIVGGTLGVQAAAIFSAIMIFILCFLQYKVLPAEDHTGETSSVRNKKAFTALKVVLRMPDVWLVGVTAAGIYATYVGTQFFLPFLNNVFVVSVLAGGIFQLFNSAVTGMIASPVSGLLADKVFKSPMRYLLFLLVGLVSGVFLLRMLPRDQALLFLNLGMLMLLAFTTYLGRGVYYAPIGEMGMPREITGGAMAVAAFIGYSPMFFAYTVYGYQIDHYEPEQAFNRIFTIMLFCSCIGASASVLLNLRNRRRRRSGRPDLFVLDSESASSKLEHISTEK